MNLAAVPRFRRAFRSPNVVPALCAAVTLGLMLLAGSVVLLSRGDVTRDADKDALNIANAAGQAIARNLQLYDQQLRMVARQVQNPSIQALPVAMRQAILFDGMSRDEHFGFINVLNARGEVLADSTSPVPNGGAWTGRDYFLAQRYSNNDALFIGAPFDRKHDAFTMIPLSRRLIQPDGSFGGVVVGSARLDYFAQLFRRFAVGRHGTIMLLRDDGTILQRIPPTPTEIGRILSPDLLTQAHDDKPLDLRDPVDQVWRRFVLRRLEGLPLAVAVGLAPEDIYADWNSRAATLLPAVLVLGALSVWLLRQVRRAAVKRDADDAALHAQGLELKRCAEQHAAMVAAQKQAHTRRVQQLEEITHDMRTSLHSLLGHADLVRQRGALSSEQAYHLTSLRGSAEHLRELADRFARDGKHVALLLEPTDIRAIIDQCHCRVGLIAEQKQLQIIFEVDAMLPERVVTDGRCVSRILTNLLDNAVKYTGRGSVALHASLEASNLRLVITDTGPGLPESQKQRLESSDAAREMPAGQHLGLSIVRRNTDALGGGIRCLHHPGGGSIICVDVPVTPELPVEPVARQDASQPPHVLVVDDSAISREPTASVLRANGYRVTEAASGEAAVLQAREIRLDVVVMDARMSGVSGPDAAARIRALPNERGAVPIIVLSATPRQVGLPVWQTVRISDYIEKSRDLAELLDAIRRIVGRAPQREAASAAGERELDALTEEVLALRSMLGRAPGELDEAMLGERVHCLGGDAGQFGFMALAAACCRYEQSAHDGACGQTDRDSLMRATSEVLTEFRQRRQELRKGARSAMPVT